MADLVPKPGALFQPLTPEEDLRNLLRAAYSAEQIAAMSRDDLMEAARELGRELNFTRRGRERIAQHVAQGRLSAYAASKYTDEEAREYLHTDTVAFNLRHVLEDPAPDAPPSQPEAPPPISAPQLSAVLGDMLALIVAQQEQINDLVYERDAFLARVGERVLDRFHAFGETGRNYKGLRFSINIDDSASEHREGSSSGSSELHEATTQARNTHAEFKVLAAQIGGLGGGRQTNLDELNKRVANYTEQFKAVTRARRKANLLVELGEVSGEPSAPKDDNR
ncbi:MAG: hypothetical protein KF850_28495 [Labilithrix sp.]|nr:hypothetical protein [Labilithrix sp.]